MPLMQRARLGSSTWLLLLRSAAVVGQLVTIFAVWVLADLDVAYLPLLGLVALTATTNVIYALWLTRKKPAATVEPSDELSRPEAIGMKGPVGRLANSTDDPSSLLVDIDDDASKSAGWIAWVLMLLDLVTLTAMLHLTGGTQNPFCFFYLVNLSVGGVMLRPYRAWTLTVVAVVGFAFLLVFSTALPELLDTNIDAASNIHRLGQMIAFTACSAVITYFVTRTSGELRMRETQLLEAQATEAANRQLEGLTTLAAGAAHELATPLSTIDVIVRELFRHLDGIEKPASVEEDLQLIDGQLEHCRQILQRMRAASGDSTTGRWDETTVGELIDVALDGVRQPHRVDVIDAAPEIEDRPLWVPQEAVAQAIRNLIHNGLDASDRDKNVVLETRVDDGVLQLIVTDSGCGMSEDVLERIGNPFYTTKDPGRGIGLGIFLTRNVVKKLGGQLKMDSTPGVGTTARIILPIRPPAN
ncbi:MULTISPECIES: sensor histidine kinase [Crateriforma]|uniref:histidine kinase n=1 Tax=Crateriforma conspicua TaxID=2527996 RepID=A0A5C6FWF2_9PLAN|nr:MULTISPECIES: ATP-binding protein [Crateriforma]TWU65985.1 Sensor histidine kinase RegB [Crateriforma conspicua]